jgi:dTDP-4-amino-4,6-dideoxy-D-galactose acyltransferase
MTEPRRLEWDSTFFGRAIARLDAPRADAAELDVALDYCRKESIDCLYFLAELSAISTLHAAEERGFHLMDVRLELTLTLGASLPAADPRLRAARDEDLVELKDLARRSHHDSRFYADQAFARERCDQLYATWIERSLAGWADAVWVAEVENRPAAYLTCHLRPNGEGEIGLVAVDERARGQGLGRALVAQAKSFFAENGCRILRVPTQGQNLRAQHLYLSQGFRPDRVFAWYHRWFLR